VVSIRLTLAVLSPTAKKSRPDLAKSEVSAEKRSSGDKEKIVNFKAGPSQPVIITKAESNQPRNRAQTVTADKPAASFQISAGGQNSDSIRPTTTQTPLKVAKGLPVIKMGGGTRLQLSGATSPASASSVTDDKTAPPRKRATSAESQQATPAETNNDAAGDKGRKSHLKKQQEEGSASDQSPSGSQIEVLESAAISKHSSLHSTSVSSSAALLKQLSFEISVHDSDVSLSSLKESRNSYAGNNAAKRRSLLGGDESLAEKRRSYNNPKRHSLLKDALDINSTTSIDSIKEVPQDGSKVNIAEIPILENEEAKGVEKEDEAKIASPVTNNDSSQPAETLHGIASDPGRYDAVLQGSNPEDASGSLKKDDEVVAIMQDQETSKLLEEIMKTEGSTALPESQVKNNNVALSTAGAEVDPPVQLQGSPASATEKIASSKEMIKSEVTSTSDTKDLSPYPQNKANLRTSVSADFKQPNSAPVVKKTSVKNMIKIGLGPNAGNFKVDINHKPEPEPEPEPTTPKTAAARRISMSSVPHSGKGVNSVDSMDAKRGSTIKSVGGPKGPAVPVDSMQLTPEANVRPRSSSLSGIRAVPVDIAKPIAESEEKAEIKAYFLDQSAKNDILSGNETPRSQSKEASEAKPVVVEAGH
jgi:hypothetical protein